MSFCFEEYGRNRDQHGRNHALPTRRSAGLALTVGAVDRDDELAEFSGRGPRLGDGGIKPDITAPGVDIVAARAAGTELGELVGDRYVRMSGTPDRKSTRLNSSH